MTPMPGEEHDEDPPPIERIHRAYRDWCVEFSETLGCGEDWLATWFEEFTHMRMYEQGMHKNLAAWMAKRDCLAWFSEAVEN